MRPQLLGAFLAPVSRGKCLAPLDPEAGLTAGSEGVGTVEGQGAWPLLGCHLLRKPFFLPASVSPLQSGANRLGQR